MFKTSFIEINMPEINQGKGGHYIGAIKAEEYLTKYPIVATMKLLKDDKESLTNTAFFKGRGVLTIIASYTQV